MDLLLQILLCALSTAGLMHVWFRTEFLAQYCALFFPDVAARWEQFNAARKTAAKPDPACPTCRPATARIPFLAWALSDRTSRPGIFLARLLTCPHCLGVWLAFAHALILHSPSPLPSLLGCFAVNTFAIYFLALMLHERPRHHAAHGPRL